MCMELFWSVIWSVTDWGRVPGGYAGVLYMNLALDCDFRIVNYSRNSSKLGTLLFFPPGSVCGLSTIFSYVLYYVLGVSMISLNHPSMGVGGL